MRIRVFLIFLFSYIISTGSSSAQIITQANSANIQQSRILLLLDRSSSMINKWSGDKARYQAADQIILQLIDSFHKVNDQVEFSLRVFGHQHVAQENDCYDTRNEVMFSKDNYTQMAFRLEDMKPLGVTPIAYALKEAAEEDLVDEQHNAYSIILITDGGESCGGNICDVVKTLIQRKVYFKPYIVSLVDYAPLKTEYSCLGDYLQVISDKDIPATVSKILNFYRPMITQTKQDYQALVDKIKANPPSVLKMNIPPVEVEKKPEPVVIKAPEPKPAPKPEPKPEPKPAPKPEPKPLPPVVKRAPDTAVSRLPIIGKNTLGAPGPAVTTFRTYKTKPAPTPVVIVKDDPINLPVSVQIRPVPVRLSIPAADRISNINAPAPKVPEDVIVAQAPPPAPKPTPPAPVVKPTPQPKPQPKPVTKPAPKPTQPPAKETQLTTVNIDNKETTVEILFTDPKHTVYYHTMPEVVLTDAATGVEVKRFHRTVDAAGNPDPVPDIKPGLYNLTIVGKNGGNIRGNQSIPVVDKKTNRITVEVSNGSLRFEYENEPNRQVDEFVAEVNQLFEGTPGPVVRQHCNQELPFPPANYHVIINTFPTTVRNVDVSFGETTVVYIPVPGYVQFTNTNALGKVALYRPQGDRFQFFHQLPVNGNPAEQRLKILPGIYEAHFVRDPKAPFISEKVVKFTVKSNAITDVELK